MLHIYKVKVHTMADKHSKARASKTGPALQPNVVIPPSKAAESMTLLPGIADELASAALAELTLEEIQIRHRVRELNEEKLSDLSYSIKKDGLLQPLVVAKFEGEHVLIAGQHRLEVCRRLRWPTIPVRLIANIRDQDHLIRLELAATKSISPYWASTASSSRGPNSGRKRK